MGALHLFFAQVLEQAREQAGSGVVRAKAGPRRAPCSSRWRPNLCDGALRGALVALAAGGDGNGEQVRAGDGRRRLRRDEPHVASSGARRGKRRHDGSAGIVSAAADDAHGTAQYLFAS